MSWMRNKPRRKRDRLIEFLVGEVFVFIKQTFPFSRLVNSAIAGLNEGKKLSGEAPLPDSDLAFNGCAKNLASLARQIVMHMALQLSVCFVERNRVLKNAA